MKVYWHKKPLLIKSAIPAFGLAAKALKPLTSPISADALFKIASKDSAQARLIHAKPWSYSEGPFAKKALPDITQTDWSLLIQGMEAHHPAAAKILSWFRFIPDARLDDLMVSIAGPGGGVGPHFDSYDVFLIQMDGKRRWRISDQKDLRLNPNLPLKILQSFKVENEWILEPGDMLYLPPHIAHDGIALDAGCQTWSVGFRSPSYKELIQEGLWRLAESLEGIPELEGHFADPMQEACTSAEQLPLELIQQIKGKLKNLKLDQVSTFLPGITAYLSEPKQQAIFDSPRNPLSLDAFFESLKKMACLPHPQTRILSLGKTVFCNGENMTQNQVKEVQAAWGKLSAQKRLAGYKGLATPKSPPDNSLYMAYMAGWLIFEPAI
jgi:50S ribosomal protein L16 3-hydroxylase